MFVHHTEQKIKHCFLTLSRSEMASLDQPSRPNNCFLSVFRLPQKDVPRDPVDNFFLFTDEKTAADKDNKEEVSACFLMPCKKNCWNLFVAEGILQKKFPTATRVEMTIQTVREFLAFAQEKNLQFTHKPICDLVDADTKTADLECTCLNPPDIIRLCWRVMPELYENEKCNIKSLHPAELKLLTTALNGSKKVYPDWSVVHYNYTHYWIVVHKKFHPIYRSMQIRPNREIDTDTDTSSEEDNDDERKNARSQQKKPKTHQQQQQQPVIDFAKVAFPEYSKNYALGPEFCLSKLSQHALREICPTIKYIPLHVANVPLQFTDMKIVGGKCPKTDFCGVFRYRASLGQLQIFSHQSTIYRGAIIYVYSLTTTEFILIDSSNTLHNVDQGSPIFDWETFPYVLYSFRCGFFE